MHEMDDYETKSSEKKRGNTIILVQTHMVSVENLWLFDTCVKHYLAQPNNLSYNYKALLQKHENLGLETIA